ncbi:MAG: ATP-binding domain-containing protein [Arcanobacterium sp.]|nr:ATP-binding domain-containing protein [Arcanobacterium sp.]MDY5589524.1 ATP-binding domain-containing protein [Arcanobacterium sp.]
MNSHELPQRGKDHAASLPAAQRAMAEEQAFVDRAYAALDSEHSYYSQHLAAVRAQGAHGTPAARSERDSFASHYEDNLLRLRNVENRLVLGRLDFIADHASDPSPHTATASALPSPRTATDQRQPHPALPRPATIHIGRITLRDAERNILLTDWRAPQSEPFYQATAAHPGNVARRRHIQTRLRTVTGVEDELFSAQQASQSGLNLAGEGALIAAMSAARDGKMGDIVATIQAEQDRVIRASGKGVLVVQGGPGTGKTAVALHRAAYLLYTERERLANSGVLLIGPSLRFLHYIDQVLPSLGESNVVATTIGELFPGVSPSTHDSPQAAEIKSRLVWRAIARRAVPTILEKPLKHTAVFTLSGKKIALTPGDVEQAQRRARHTNKPHNQARTVYAKFLVEQLAQRLAQALETSLGDSSWLVADVAGDPDITREINRHWLPASPQWLLEHMYKWPEILEQVAPELTANERSTLRRERGSGFSIADIPLLDELAEYLGPFSSDAVRREQAAQQQSQEQLASYMADTMTAMGLGGGIVSSTAMVNRIAANAPHATVAETAALDRTWTYGHVVVDEAQELTPMQWVMVARRNPSRSMTLVGDLDQRTHTRPGESWKDALGELGAFARVEELTISYRTPASILQRAAQAMEALGLHVRTVQGARDIPGSYSSKQVAASDMAGILSATLTSQWDFLEHEYGAGLGSLAVIAPESQLEQVTADIHAIAAAHEWPTALSTASETRRITVATASMVKGLEFDTVIVLEPGELGRESLGNLYVALTRATKRLTVLSTEALPRYL